MWSSHYPGPTGPWILVPLVIPRPSVSPGGAQASTRPSLSRGRTSRGEDLPVGGPIRGEVLGEDSGWIWIGRSRNDHVAAALRLYILERSSILLKTLAGARRLLLGKARAYEGVVLPGYTHGQPSQVLTGHASSWHMRSLCHGPSRLYYPPLSPAWSPPWGLPRGPGASWGLMRSG